MQGDPCIPGESPKHVPHLPFQRDRALENEIRERCREVRRQMDTVIVGESAFKETMELAVMAEGSVIAEGAPGHGKSLGTQTFSRVVGLSHKRIEGVNGLMPYDIQGGVNHRTGELVLGPIFHQFVMFEEINRVEGKTKSALLNPMQDHYVSFTDWPEIVPLPRPHIVVATYNPTEVDQTVFPLTTAEQDRFMFRVRLQKKSLEEMEAIAVLDASVALENTKQILSTEDILRYNRYIRAAAGSVSTEHPMVSYISRLAVYMQEHKRAFEEGASPRAVRSFWQAMVAYGVINGIERLQPEHVRHLIRRCWFHRLITRNPERRNQLIDEALENVRPIP